MPPGLYRGFETVEHYPMACDVFRFDLYTSLRLIKVITHAWSPVDMAATAVCIDDAESGEPPEFPIARRPKN